jgi:hypothetical protein
MTVVLGDADDEDDEGDYDDDDDDDHDDDGDDDDVQDDKSSGSAELSLDFFTAEGHRRIQARSDVMDCHIYVCSPEVQQKGSIGQRGGDHPKSGVGL